MFDDAQPTVAPGAGVVLLVEDEVDAAESTAMALRLMGAEVDVAHDFQAALATLAARPADVLVCDIRLGNGPDGYDLLAAVRAGRAGAASVLVPAIAVSAFGADTDRHRSAQAGFSDHLTKPVDAAAIAQAAAAAVAASAMATGTAFARPAPST